MNPRVVFFQIQSAKQKLEKLIWAAHHHFALKDSLLILVENDTAAQFVDTLLWKEPFSSFLPHSIANGPSNDKIAITKIKQNVNEATIAFNLCPTPLLIEGPFQLIYEFDDATNPSKKNLSTLRYDAYKKQHYPIEAR